MLANDLLQRAAEALEYQAASEAGMSQAPDLFTPQETQAWEDAVRIRAYLRRSAARKSNANSDQ